MEDTVLPKLNTEWLGSLMVRSLNLRLSGRDGSIYKT